MELDSLMVRLLGDASAYQQTLGLAQATTQRFASSTASILAQVGLSFSLLGTAIKGVQMAARSEATQVDLEVMLGSADQAKKTIADLVAFSERTPLRMPALLDATKLLTQMGVTATDVVPLLKMMGDAAGGNADRLQSMALTMGRVISSGRLTSREVRTLTMSGFNPMKDMAAVTGKSVAEMNVILRKGGIGADVLIKAFMNADRAGGTFSGRMERASQTLPGLFSTMQDAVSKPIKEIGNVLIEGLDLKNIVRQVTDGAKMVAAALKALSPDTKRIIAEVLTGAAAFGLLSFGMLALGPVIGMLGSVLGPVVALLGAVPAIIGFILTPAGLLTAAIVGAAAAVLYFTGAGGQSLQWFGEQWGRLADFMAPALKGIKAALAGGDLAAAFRVGWAQVQLAFAEGLAPLREGWANFVFTMKYVWAEGAAGIQSLWEKVTTGIATGMIVSMSTVGAISTEAGAGMIQSMTQDLQRNLATIDKERKGAIASALDDSTRAISDAQKALDAARAERDKTVADAVKIPPLQLAPFKVPEIDPNKFKMAPMKVPVTPVLKFDAAAFYSAEAVSRINEFRDMMAGFGGGKKGKGIGTEGVAASGAEAAALVQGAFPAPATPAAPVPVQATGTQPNDPVREKILAVLTRIAESTELMAKRPAIELKPAGLK